MLENIGWNESFPSFPRPSIFSEITFPFVRHSGEAGIQW